MDWREVSWLAGAKFQSCTIAAVTQVQRGAHDEQSSPQERASRESSSLELLLPPGESGPSALQCRLEAAPKGSLRGPLRRLEEVRALESKFFAPNVQVPQQHCRVLQLPEEEHVLCEIPAVP